ncbi:hypothetical protein OSB04_024877 [Centaurea solstitialis]|uniref:Reverse transcriptase domain-containing protein n=1 Tax=Centaurea solstitialis TaxID=347529 RepID=A0AA38SZ95_9ASTR|nr:hypothetical protein OSB04_024877 [Centaurea solstitialis]
MSYDSEQTAITEFRLQITSMLFLSSAISSTSLMEEVFTSVDRISRLQNRLESWINKKLKAARDRQKSYADNRRKPLEFQIGDRVLLKIWKEREVEPPIYWAVQNPGKNWASHLQIGLTLGAQLYSRHVSCVQSKEMPVKVRWNSRHGPEFTWEREALMKDNYPHLFTKNPCGSSKN